MIPALGVNEPHASAIVHGIKTWETRGQPPNGEMRPDGVTGFPGVRLPRGGRIMVVANAKRPTNPTLIGEYGSGHLVVHDDEGYLLHNMASNEMLDLHPGHVVGSVTVTDAVPIRSVDTFPEGADLDFDHLFTCTTESGGTSLWTHVVSDGGRRLDRWAINDQLPWGLWEPGRWAWQLAQPLTTNEMCPVCEGRVTVMSGGTELNVSPPCPVCHGAGRCDPIPVRGHQGLRPPKPEQFR